MKNLKKFLAVVLSVAIMATSMATAFAADTTTDPLKDKYPEAATMKALGILQGSNGVTEAYLKQEPVRIQAAVLTLRLTGDEATARAYAGLAHFADKISDTYWAKNIMGYLKANPSYGWLGDANGKLNPEAKIKKQEFAKVLLKAMGYDQGTHYQWGNNGDGVMAAYMAAGLTTLLDVDESLTMNDIAVAINEALSKPCRNSTETLVWRLAKKNADFKAAAIKENLISDAITSVVAPTTASAVEGSIVTPPAQVTANYSDGSSKLVDVKWSAEKFDTSKVGEAALTGTIDGYAAGVTAKLNVVAAAITNVEDVVFDDVYVGDEVTLPETVDATFSNGKVDAVPVTWAPADVDTSEAADLTFEGTVAGYDKKVSATMSVVENVIEEVAAVADVTVNEGSELVLPENVEATYTNGDVAEVPVVWDTTAVDVNAPKTYAVKGTVEGFEAGAAVNVVVAPVALDYTLTANNLKEVTVTFNKPLVADNLVKGNFKVNDADVPAATVIDSKSVRLTAATAIGQQGTFEVTVKTGTGMAAESKKKTAAVVDGVIPEVLSVDPVGNTGIKITFSEPVVSGYTTLSNYKLNNAYFGAAVPTIDATGRVVTITPTARLSAGVNKISISNIADVPSYKIVPVVDKEFIVATDSTAPSFVSVESATQTKVVLVMSENILTPGVDDVVGGPVNETDRSVDGNKLTLTYGTGSASAVPVGGMTLTLKNITDAYGNKAADMTVTVPAPTLDLARPAFVSAVAEGSTNASMKIVATFDKEVQTKAGSFTLKDADGNTVSGLSALTTYTDGDGNAVKTKIYVSGDISEGSYKLSISGVVDNSGLENVMLPVSDVAVTVADKTAPTVPTLVAPETSWYKLFELNADGTVKTNKLFVRFDEAVSEASAETKANYSYIDESGIVRALNADTTVNLLSDNKTVEIAFDAATPVANVPATATKAAVPCKVISLQVSGVTDNSGNASAAYIKNTSALASDLGAAPSVAAKVTGKNTIVLDVTGTLVPSTISLADFAVNAGAGTIRIYNATYADNKITLSTVEDISANAKYTVADVAQDVKVTIPASASSKDVFGQSLTAATLTAADVFVPTIAFTSAIGSTDAVTGAKKTEIILTGSEALTMADATVFQVIIDGALQKYAAVLAGNVITITVQDAAGANVDLTGKTVNVKYFQPINNAIVDKAAVPNKVSSFEFSAGIE